VKPVRGEVAIVTAAPATVTVNGVVVAPVPAKLALLPKLHRISAAAQTDVEIAC
jgi:hypothetical protein